MSDFASRPGTCDIEWFGPEKRDIDFLVEIPHGATRAADYRNLQQRLQSNLPDDLIEFFFVNTDVGAPECGREVARQLAQRGLRSAVVIGRVPRTFIDLNRTLDEGKADGVKLTPVFPDYIDHPDDREHLSELHLSYQQTAARAYESVCGRGGFALTLHTYAPRSVNITDIDAGIVQALREAYHPEAYGDWPRRPAVDLITEDPAGKRLAPSSWIDAVTREYAELGIDARQNATYRLSARSSGYRYSATYPDHVLCVEISRDLLAEPFTPFEEMRIANHKAERMATPLARSVAGLIGS